MKIGIFDSGLGGLITLHGAREALAAYDVVYLGDTAHLPYGDKTKEQVFEFTKRAVEYLFKQDCKLVFLFCNTASAEALRKIQQEFLPKFYPNRHVLGIIIPTVEVAITSPPGHDREKRGSRRIGVLATQGTVDSHTYLKEIQKRNSNAEVFQQAAPKLVPHIESGILTNLAYARLVNMYLDPLLERNIDTLILGCTHYAIIKNQIKKLLPLKVQLICQDEIIGSKITEYLSNHAEIETILSKNKTRQYLVTKLTPEFENHAKAWLGESLKLERISL